MTRSIQRGFTMLEVLVTLAIFSISLIVLIQAQTRSMSNVQNVRDYEKAVFIAENQLHWTMLDLNEAEEWQQYAEASGEDMGCNWSVVITPVDSESDTQGNATLLKIVATVEWPQGRNNGLFELETWYLWGESQ